MAGVSVNLSGNFSKLDELKDKANNTGNSIKKAFGSNLGKAAFAGMATAATAAFAAIVAGTISAIKAGGELSDMIARTGADGEKLFVLQRAFENAGIAAATVPSVLNKMQKALAGVNEDGERVVTRVFNDLNLNVEQLRRLDPAEAFRTIGEAIARIDDPAKRAALGMEIFGKSAGSLLVLMDDSQAFANAEQQVGSLGRTLSDNAAELDVAADSMELYNVKMQQLGAEVAVSLLPQLLRFSQWLNEQDLARFGEVVGDLATKFIHVAEALKKVSDHTPKGWLRGKLWDAYTDSVGKEDKAQPSLSSKHISGLRPTADFEKNKSAADRREEAALAQKAATEAERAAEAAEKKAEADKKSAEETARKRAEGLEEYKLEAAIINARIAGDAKHLEAAEREKRIREEIRKLESQGFTAAEAREGATKKVDAEARATAAEKKKADEDFLKSLGDPAAEAAAIMGGEDAMAKLVAENRRMELELQGVSPAMAATIAADEASLAKIGELKAQADGMGFSSTLGAVSSMRGIGGGGAAVSSGLDYQRQLADINREMLSELRTLNSRTPAPSVEI